MADLIQPNLPSPAGYWPGNNAAPAGEQPYKRSKKTKKDLLACYDRRVKLSRKWREENFDKTWRRMIDLYRGKHFSGQSSADRIAINVSFSTVNVIVPSVAVNFPQITVNGRGMEDEGGAQVAEAAVNYWWQRYGYQPEVKRAVKDSLVLGIGWVKLGWKYREQERPLSMEEKAEHYESQMMEADEAARENPWMADQLPSNADIMAGIPQTEPEVVLDHPSVERVSPFDIFIDPEATCVDDLKWIAQRLVVPIEEVKADGRYSQAARKKLKPDMSANPRWRDRDKTQTSSSNDEKLNDDISRVTLYEYWDLQHQYYCVFAAGSDEFLLDPTEFPYPFGIPFVPLHNYEVPDQFYSVGDLEMIEPMQQELNAVRSDMMNHRKRWQRAYLARRDKLDPAAQNALLSDKDGRIVWVEGDEPLQDIVSPIAQIPLDPQMYTYSQQIEQDLQLVSGVTEYQRGAAPEIRRTATEASLIQSATNARVSDKLAQIEQFMATIAKRIVQLAQVYLTGDQVARIVGPDGAKQWVQFTREDIEGEFDFMVEAGSTQPKDEQFRQQRALQLMQTVGPFVGSLVDPMAMLTYVLRDAFGVKDPSQFIMQQQPQQQGEDQSQKLVEQINYRDAPPDIQRQMEQAAGYQPSQMGGTSPSELVAQKNEGSAQTAAMQLQDRQDQHARDMDRAEYEHMLAMEQAAQKEQIDAGLQDQQAANQQDQLMMQMMMQQQQQAQAQQARGQEGGGE